MERMAEAFGGRDADGSRLAQGLHVALEIAAADNLETSLLSNPQTARW
jgi:hypothetical protein